jgi:hypothetical protein
MLEQAVERLLDDMAEREQPHPGVSIQQAIEEGRKRLRRRRLLRVVGAPALAVSAALAVVLTGTLPPSGHGSPQPASYGAFVQGAFNPSHLTIGFGWLPKGYLVADGETTTGGEELLGFGPHGQLWVLSVYARAMCHLSGSGSQLECLPALEPLSGLTGFHRGIDRPGPSINGHRSFWLLGGRSFAWEYGPAAWALLQGVSVTGGGPAAPRIARAVTIGQRPPPLYGQRATLGFAARFTAIPQGWRLINVVFDRVQNRFQVQNYVIARLRTISPVAGDAADVPGEPSISVVPGTRVTRECGFGNPHIPHPKVTSHHVTIHGGRFTVVSTVSGKPYQELCGVHDGLEVRIGESGAPQAFSPTQVMERLQLLGPKPGDWVTNPLR